MRKGNHRFSRRPPQKNCSLISGHRSGAEKPQPNQIEHPTAMMRAPKPSQCKYGAKSSSLMFFIILGVIVAAIIAFLVFHPTSGGVGPDTTPPSAQH